MLLLLLIACSDYDLEAHTDPPAGVSPDVEVTPAVDVLTCGSAGATVTVSNAGDGDLEISDLHVDGDGWTLVPPPLPLVLPPGASEDLALEGTEGEALLVVESDDPDDPVVEVPLSAVADAPPEVAIVGPDPGAVLAPGDPVSLRGNVWDAEDPADALSLEWRSSVDGVLSSDPSGPGGEAVYEWEAPRAEGPHELTLTARDSCGHEVSDTLEVCQQAGYLASELDIDTWHFEGVARWDTSNDWLELTTAGTGLVGTAFQTAHTVSGDSVQIRFEFYIGGGTGADGISLTALDTDRMTTFLGGAGCGIGYGGDADCTAGPALPGWSIEVDTYYNAGQDPTELDHVMFTFDGDVDDPAIWATLPEMEDTGWHVMVVDVSAPRVRVAIDGVAYIDQDLAGHFGFPAYVGFTAGTGGSTNNHLIDALEVTNLVCD